MSREQDVSGVTASLVSRTLDLLSPLLSPRPSPTASPRTPAATPATKSQAQGSMATAAGEAAAAGPAAAAAVAAALSAAKAASRNPAKQPADSMYSPNDAALSPRIVTAKAAYAAACPSSHLATAAGVTTAASPTPTLEGGMTVFPALEQLLVAARNCALPPMVPASEPDCPKALLALSPAMPPRMLRAKWCLADYAVTDKLYAGYASSVFKGFCRRSHEVVVLKVYKLAAVCDLYKYQILREIQLHSSLHHENVVKMHAAFQEGDSVVMVEEYASGADLFAVLQRYGGRLSERTAVQMVLDPFLRVLDHLHTRGIIHRDIKPENILFSQSMVLKLADFGLAIDLGRERAVTRAGTLDYMAPEVLHCPYKSHPNENKDNAKLHYDGAVDAWAVGILAYELLVGCPPFYDKHRKDTEERILKAAPPMPAGLSGEAKNFIRAALCKDPLQRLSVHEMLQHPWLAAHRGSVRPAKKDGLLMSADKQRPSRVRAVAVHADATELLISTALLPTAGKQPTTPRVAPVLQPGQLAIQQALYAQLQQQQQQLQATVPQADVVLPSTPHMPTPNHMAAFVAAAAVPATSGPKHHPAVFKPHTPAPSPRTRAAVAAAAGSPRDAVAQLLGGKGTLEEYLREQRQARERQRQQQAAARAKAKGREVEEQGWAAAQAPSDRLAASLSPRTGQADGTVVMNVRAPVAKVAEAGKQLLQQAPVSTRGPTMEAAGLAAT